MEMIHICKSRNEKISIILPIFVGEDIKLSIHAYTFLIILHAGKSGEYISSDEKKYIWKLNQTQLPYSEEIQKLIELGIISYQLNSFNKARYTLTQPLIGIKSLEYSISKENYFKKIANHYPKFLKVVG